MNISEYLILDTLFCAFKNFFFRASRGRGHTLPLTVALAMAMQLSLAQPLKICRSHPWKMILFVGGHIFLSI